jgi:hypothetical protein
MEEDKNLSYSEEKKHESKARFYHSVRGWEQESNIQYCEGKSAEIYL